MSCRLVAVAILLTAPPALAQAPADTAALDFLGFRAGAPLYEVAAWVREHRGTRLRCDRAKADPRVRDCRAQLHDPITGDTLDLWASAIDSTTAILTLSGTLPSAQLDRWRRGLERRYGRVGATAQGNQWMMQWVRRGRMIRLTWRVGRGAPVVSVSLVDGRVLDGWGGPPRPP